MAATPLKFPISVGIIVRNCADAVLHCLGSLKDFLVHPDDEIVVVDTGSTDDTVAQVMRRHKFGDRLHVLERPDLNDPEMPERMRRYKPAAWAKYGNHPQFVGGCVSDFARARAVTLAAAKNPVYFWIDADDVLECEKDFRAEVDAFFAQGGEAFFMRYDYAHDAEDGACTTTLWRERFLLRGRYYWAGRCHEVLLPRGGFQAPVMKTVRGIIRHVGEYRKQHEFSDLRNYAILRTELEKIDNLDRVDPRTLYYLGNACRGLGDHLEAISLYEEFLPRSGSRDDRVLALLHIGQLYCMMGRPWRAIRVYQEAELVHPTDPRPFFGQQRAFFDLGLWEQSIAAGRRGLATVGQFGTLNSVDPMQLVSFPHYFVACAARELNDLGLAQEAAAAFLRSRPDLPVVRTFVDALKVWGETGRWCAALHQVLQKTVSLPCRVEVLRSLNIPPMAPLFGVARPEESDNRKGRRRVAIFCPSTLEGWGPDAAAVGIGGSERMVAEMARRLQQRGLAVSVYCNLREPKQAGYHDDVLWQHYLAFDPTRARQDLVLWRVPAALNQLQVPAERRYVWMHDIGHDADWTPVRQALLTKAIFLSPWHRAQHSHLPDDKVYLSRNGVDDDLIRQLAVTPPARDPFRVVYASSPDRGLWRVLRIWKTLADQGRLPVEAHLDIFYGFNSMYVKSTRQHEYLTVDGVQRHRLDYMEEIFRLIDAASRVQMHGRKSEAEVLTALLGAGALFYPASFPETFCIAAAEAQACGCWPITSNLAALQTTVRHGTIVTELNDAEFAVALEEYFQKPPTDEDRRRIAIDALETFSLNTLADQWSTDLFGDNA